MASLIQRPDRPTWYLQYYVSGKLKRVSTGTDSFQIAREKLRQFESAQARGMELPLPSKTPIADVVTAYVNHIRAVKTAKSAQTDVYYLRDAFGPICDGLKITSRKISAKTKKRPPKPGQDPLHVFFRSHKALLDVVHRTAKSCGNIRRRDRRYRI